MKKQFTFLTLCCCFFTAYSQNITIPDANFKARLLSVADTNSDGEIQQSEAVAITNLNVNTSINDSNGDITSLEGIQYFTGLKELKCLGNQLTSLDLTTLPLLEKLNCSNNNITSLNITGLTNLKEVWCNNNELATLNTTGLTGLENLFCHVNNLSFINLENIPALKVLKISDNDFTSLNATLLPNVQSIVCSGNQLTSLNVANMTSLLEIEANTNMLTSIDLTGLSNLRFFSANANEISSIVLTPATVLESLSLDANPITSIDLNSCPTLNSVTLSNCQLTTIDTSETAIYTLYCSNNPDLTSINVQNGIFSLSDPDLLYYAFDFNELPSLTSICFDNGEQIGLAGTGFDPEGNVTLYTGENCDVEIFLSAKEFEISPVTAYPNPFTKEMTIASSDSPKKIEVTDMNGRTIANPVFSSNGNATNINLDNITQTGMYIMKITYADKIHLIKVVKQ